MARTISSEIQADHNAAALRAEKSAQGGMTEDDPYMRGGQLAAMFCIGFAFLVPSLLLVRVVF